MNAANIEAGKKFLEENKKREGVVTLPSGLQYEVITEGNVGHYAKATDQVQCHYEGTLIDGTLFDSSIKRGQPATFGVNQVIPGWVEALQLMPEGAKWKLYIPGAATSPSASIICRYVLSRGLKPGAPSAPPWSAGNIPAILSPSKTTSAFISSPSAKKTF